MSEWHILMRNGISFQLDDFRSLLDHVEARPILLDQIREIQALIEKVKASDLPGFSIDDSGLLWLGLRLCVPRSRGLREEILTKGHSLFIWFTQNTLRCIEIFVNPIGG